MRWQRYLMGLCFWAVLSVARAAVELSALASAGGDFRFILTNAETRVNSGWLSVGESFEEHRISRFNVADEVLTLDRGGESIQLRLKHEPVEQTGTRRRRVLDDGGAAERRKREIPIWIDGYGNVALGATAVTFDEIEALFRRLVEANATVEIVFVHAPLAPKENPERMRSTKNRVLGRAQAAELRKLTSRVIEVGRGR
jgi:hypothetical protein